MKKSKGPQILLTQFEGRLAETEKKGSHQILHDQPPGVIPLKVSPQPTWGDLHYLFVCFIYQTRYSLAI